MSIGATPVLTVEVVVTLPVLMLVMAKMSILAMEKLIFLTNARHFWFFFFISLKLPKTHLSV